MARMRQRSGRVRQQGRQQVTSERSGILRAGDGYLYSTFRLFTSAAVPVDVVVAATADNGNLMFATQRGATGQGFGAAIALTALETNMDNAGKMPSELGYKINQMGFHTCGDVDVRAAMLIARFSTLRLVMPEYVYEFGPAELWPTGNGMQGFGAVGGGNGSVGAPLPQATMRRFKKPLLLPADKTFSIGQIVVRAFTIPAAFQSASQPVDIRVALWGDWISKI